MPRNPDVLGGRVRARRLPRSDLSVVVLLAAVAEFFLLPLELRLRDLAAVAVPVELEVLAPALYGLELLVGEFLVRPLRPAAAPPLAEVLTRGLQPLLELDGVNVPAESSVLLHVERPRPLVAIGQACGS